MELLDGGYRLYPRTDEVHVLLEREGDGRFLGICRGCGSELWYLPGDEAKPCICGAALSREINPTREEALAVVKRARP